jgi:hypothetical protein
MTLTRRSWNTPFVPPVNDSTDSLSCRRCQGLLIRHQSAKSLTRSKLIALGFLTSRAATKDSHQLQLFLKQSRKFMSGFHNPLVQTHMIVHVVSSSRLLTMRRVNYAHSRDLTWIAAFVLDVEYAPGTRELALHSDTMLYAEMTIESGVSNSSRFTQCDVFVNFRTSATFSHVYWDRGFGDEGGIVRNRCHSVLAFAAARANRPAASKCRRGLHQ